MSTRSRSSTPAASMRPGAETRQNLSAIAYDALRARLRSAEVTLEDRLVDLDIAAQLGMSRMPVREALLQLVAEGYLESTARGYRIATLSHQDVLDVFELRLLLDPRAAAMAARDLARAGIQRLAAALAEARAAVAAQDIACFFQANIAFRETWVAAVRNQRLAAAISRYADQILTVRHITLREPAIQPVVLDGLAAQCRAFQRGDPIAAHDATVRFVLAAERAYLARTDTSATTPSARRDKPRPAARPS